MPLQITWRIIPTKLRATSEKNRTEIESQPRGERWGCGCIGTVDLGHKLAESWNHIQTLKDFLCRHIFARPTDERSWWEEEGGTTKGLFNTLLRRVGVGCLRVLREWVEWMWNRPMLCTPFSKKRMHNLFNLGPIYLQKMLWTNFLGFPFFLFWLYI